MKIASSAELGVVGVAHLTSEDIRAADRTQTPVVTGLESKDRSQPYESLEPVKRNVPQDWYDNLQRARKAKQKVVSDHEHKKGIVGIGVRAGIAGGDNADVIVDISGKHAEKRRGEIPEERNGTPITVRKGPRITPDGHSSCDSGNSYCNDYYHGSSIPGGMQCEGTDSSGPVGTLCSPITKSNGDVRFATAGHIFGAACACGQHFWHPTESDYDVGTVSAHHCYDDIALIEPENGHSPEREIQDANPSAVQGQFTKSGVADLRRRGEFIKKVGWRSCKTCGKIESEDYTHSGYGCTPKDGQVKWGEATDSKGGDSGAPVYHVNPNNTDHQWIVNISLWSGSFSAGGTSAWSIYNKHGYIF